MEGLIMEVKVLGNAIILQEVTEIDFITYLVRIDCIDMGDDESPFVINQYMIVNGTMQEVETNKLESVILRLIGKLVQMVHGGVYNTEHNYTYK